MFEAKELSRVIRARKKNRLAPDLDDAGQEGLPPEQALAADLNAKVNEMTGEDHEPASEAEMGGDGTSQEQKSLKRAMSIINSYFSKMMIKK